MKLLNVILSLVCFLLAACNPDEVVIEVRADDMTDAMKGETVMIPALYKFSMLGDDKEAAMEKVTEIVRKYLPEDSKLSVSNRTLGKELTVKSSIPLVQFDGKKSPNLRVRKSPVMIALIEGKTQFPGYSKTLMLVSDDEIIEKLNQELSNVAFGLKFSPLAKTTNFEFEGGGEAPLEILSVATFVDGKASLLNVETLQKRQTATITFKASVFEGSSIWDQIPIHVFLK